MRRKRKKRRKLVFTRNVRWTRSKKYNYNTLNKHKIVQLVIIFFLVLFLFYLIRSQKVENEKQDPIYNSYQEKIAALEISPEIINDIFKRAKNDQKDEASLFAAYIVQKESGKSDEDILKNISSYKPGFFTPRKLKKMYKEAKECYKQFITDIKVFPVPEDYQYTFENSWNAERTYGGLRKHYGTDIMDPQNKRGEIPIVSISQGVIESIGWINMGGYRIGVRTKNGGYIYYAHLDRYAPKLKKGSKLEVGDYIGYMGDSGYGEEGTVGAFPVHLHIGIATKALGSKEAWVNPYYILKYLEDKKQ